MWQKQSTVYDEKCDTSRNLSLWHEFTTQFFTENDWLKQVHYEQWHKNENDHLNQINSSGTTVNITDLISPKPELFLCHDFDTNGHANLSMIERKT